MTTVVLIQDELETEKLPAREEVVRTAVPSKELSANVPEFPLATTVIWGEGLFCVVVNAVLENARLVPVQEIVGSLSTRIQSSHAVPCGEAVRLSHLFPTRIFSQSEGRMKKAPEPAPPIVADLARQASVLPISEIFS